MKKSIIITLAAVGIITGYMLINPVGDNPAADTEQSAHLEAVVSSWTEETADPAPSVDPVINVPATSPIYEPSSLLSSAVNSNAIGNELANALTISDEETRSLELTKILLSLTPENWVAAKDAYTYAATLCNFNRADWLYFIRRSGESGGGVAMQYFEVRSLQGGRLCFENWLETNPNEALKWMVDDYTDANKRMKITSGLMGGYIDRNGLDEGEEIFQEAVDHIIATGSNTIRSNYLKKMFDSIASRAMNRSLAEVGGLDKSKDWLRGHAGQPYVRSELVARTTKVLIGQHDGAAAIKWLDACKAEHPDMPSQYYDSVITEWSKADGENAVSVWLNNNTNHPQYDRFAYVHAKNVFKKDPEAALAWAHSISDKTLKAKLLQGGGIW